MGREIRRVPGDWEHPKGEDGEYKPLHDCTYDEAMEDWIQGHYAWLRGDHPKQETRWAEGCTYFAQFRPPPDVEYLDLYRDRFWTKEEATHWVMYENVSEGTPLTPSFATKEELASYLSTEEDFAGYGPVPRKAAEEFIERAWAPSMVINRATGEAKRNVESLHWDEDNGR